MEEYRKIKNAIRKGDLNDLSTYIDKPVNFSGDYLLHVLTASKKTDLVIKLVHMVNAKRLLEARNQLKDTALHVAAATGDLPAAREMILKNKELLSITNKLALEIAQQFSDLIFGRNFRAVTPLHLIATIPQAFRSATQLGFVESLIYACFPLNYESSSKIYSKGITEGDEEKQKMTVPNTTLKDGELLDDETTCCMIKARKLFHNIMEFPAVRWLRLFLIKILKKMFTMVEEIQEQKKNHACVLNLIAYLAKDDKYWDFLEKGKKPQAQGDEKIESIDGHELMDFPHDLATPKSDSIVPSNSQEKKEDENISKEKELVLLSPELEGLISKLSTTLEKIENQKEDETKEDLKPISRWNESPLTLGAKMGLHEFVEKILKVCPESAKSLDTDGRNVLQVAIQHGQVKIVNIIETMVRGSNPLLPSRLLWDIDPKTKNNILHFAAEEKKTVPGDPCALQMQLELGWFERVKKLIPKDLENSRNNNEKTAQELFTENHMQMVKNGKEQLTKMGKTCSVLVVAVMFASSFSIPGDKDSNHNPVFIHKTTFKVFSHAYWIGLSCAATALVLFLSLLTSSYREQDFRRSLPTKYFFANISFFLALVALLVAFSCNMYLSIYGGGASSYKGLGAFHL
ncbi:uncharacterized protein LOC120258160 [Dioscorea cayenensis subsp. rotundata]|uniref:Uncharacterized protein LOC120258160 n=1 Tax=Dioscorea cayennensis subsp. rotundata TaxID=55577 RepID=A0AB40B2C0_DIOCR|nr:uncharacterized protein LOC120258160 [Dioscorea cayenensis subsp. rotundata]